MAALVDIVRFDHGPPVPCTYVREQLAARLGLDICVRACQEGGSGVRTYTLFLKVRPRIEVRLVEDEGAAAVCVEASIFQHPLFYSHVLAVLEEAGGKSSKGRPVTPGGRRRTATGERALQRFALWPWLCLTIALMTFGLVTAGVLALVF